MAAVAAVVLGTIAAHHPALRMVDFIAFSNRVQHLIQGREWADGLYPVGYPLLLWAGHALGVDVLATGKVLSVAGAVLAVVALTRILGWRAGLWLLASAPLLRFGTVEGTDMLAAGFTLAAVATAHERRPVWAGALVGLAFLTRYTALSAVPVVLWLSPRRGLCLGVLVAATAPHWAVALWLGAPLLPDSVTNVSIGAGHASTLWSLETLYRWPGSFWQALQFALSTWLLRLAALGLVVGVLRRDRRARALLALGICHLALLAVAFSNDRLVLPAALAAAAGAYWLLPRRLGLGLAAMVSASLSLGPAWTPEPDEVVRAELARRAEPLLGHYASTNPWFYTRRDGWLQGSVPLMALRSPPSPEGLAKSLPPKGLTHLVVDPHRSRSTRWLGPLLTGQEAAGFQLVVQVNGWSIYAVNSLEDP